MGAAMSIVTFLLFAAIFIVAMAVLGLVMIVILHRRQRRFYEEFMGRQNQIGTPARRRVRP